MRFCLLSAGCEMNNYFGTLSMSRAFAPILKANGRGAIANVLSIVSFFNLPANALQAASKLRPLRGH